MAIRKAIQYRKELDISETDKIKGCYIFLEYINQQLLKLF